MTRPSKKPKASSDPYPPGWEPFLAAIKADMDDDTPRLVFADWLQENGDEDRAEFIRLQCRIHHRIYDDPLVVELGPRVSDLLKANEERWLAGFPQWFKKNAGAFNRGFVSNCRMTGARFLKDGAAITRLTPLDELDLDRVTPDALRSPTLSEVGGLHLAIVDSARVEALASHPNLRNLRYLFVCNGSDNGMTYRPTVRLSGEAVGALVANPTLSRLERFELNGTKHGDAVAFGLAAGAYTRLSDLTLYHSDLSAKGLKALVNSASAPTLTNLYFAGNLFGDEGIQHLVEAPALGRLESLNFIGCGLSAESARLLAAWPGLRTVRWFQLSDNTLTQADADCILKSPHAVALTREKLGI